MYIASASFRNGVHVLQHHAEVYRSAFVMCRDVWLFFGQKKRD